MTRRRHPVITSLAAMLPVWIAAIGFSFALTECDGNPRDVAVPRPTAYPRVLPYDTLYTPIDRLPVVMEVNSYATVTRGDDRDSTATDKINISYPRYGATLYCTYTPVTAATATAVIDNRVERMSLNAGSLSTEISRLTTPAGVDATILVTPEARVTPVQFLATDSATFVLTGALYFANSASSSDSIRPVLDAVSRDIVHTVTHLRRR